MWTFTTPPDTIEGAVRNGFRMGARSKLTGRVAFLLARPDDPWFHLPMAVKTNMSPHPVTHDGVIWRTTEALFQALRFAPNDPVREAIRGHKSPMQAKFAAKAAAERMIVTQCSETDIANMRTVLGIKHAAHADVRAALDATADMLIVEDCTRRQRGSGLFWGAALNGHTWQGQNWLGLLWMELRGQL